MTKKNNNMSHKYHQLYIFSCHFLHIFIFKSHIYISSGKVSRKIFFVFIIIFLMPHTYISHTYCLFGLTHVMFVWIFSHPMRTTCQIIISLLYFRLLFVVVFIATDKYLLLSVFFLCTRTYDDDDEQIL